MKNNHNNQSSISNVDECLDLKESPPCQTALLYFFQGKSAYRAYCHTVHIPQMCDNNMMYLLRIFIQVMIKLRWQTFTKEYNIYKNKLSSSNQEEVDNNFLNSLIIQKERAKKITTTREVWKSCDLNYDKIWSILALNFSKTY